MKVKFKKSNSDGQYFIDFVYDLEDGKFKTYQPYINYTMKILKEMFKSIKDVNPSSVRFHFDDPDDEAYFILWMASINQDGGIEV